MTRRILLLILLVGLAATAGCDAINYMAYLFAPAMPAKPVPAEFEGLEGHSVAVVIFADQQVQYEYPFARLTLGSAVAAELTEQLKDVRVVDVRKVCRYQDENLYWETMDKTELARRLEADYVLIVDLLQYGTREPGSLNLYRGTIAAQPALYAAAREEHEAKIWGGKVTVTYPSGEAGGVPATDDRGIRNTTERLFARELVRKFRKYKPGADDET